MKNSRAKASFTSAALVCLMFAGALMLNLWLLAAPGAVSAFEVQKSGAGLSPQAIPDLAKLRQVFRKIAFGYLDPETGELLAEATTFSWEPAKPVFIRWRVRVPADAEHPGGWRTFIGFPDRGDGEKIFEQFIGVAYRYEKDAVTVILLGENSEPIAEFRVVKPAR